MTGLIGLIGLACAASSLVLLAVWLGPRLLLWAMNWYIGRYYRMLRKFQERQEERHEEMLDALAGLEQAMEARRQSLAELTVDDPARHNEETQ